MATMEVTGKQRRQADAWLKICKASTGGKEGPEGHGGRGGRDVSSWSGRGLGMSGYKQEMMCYK